MIELQKHNTKQNRLTAAGIVLLIVILLFIFKNKRIRIVSKAKKYVSQNEISPNAGFVSSSFEKEMKNIGWYNGAEWCAFFARMIWLKTLKGQQKELADKLLSGSSQQTYVNFAKDKSGYFTVSQKPKKGDIVIWQSINEPAKGHAGIISRVIGDTFHTIEGNSNRDGSAGVVAKAKYSLKQQRNKTSGLKIRGFIHAK